MIRFLLAMGCLATSATGASDPPAPARPSILIVMTDDQGLGDFSFTGNPVLKTPNLDAFARQAVRLTDFHVAPMCSPTRGQLLTGLAALRNGATSVTAGRTFLRPGLATLAEVFRDQGYRTGIFGKWHLGDTYPNRPHDKGFEHAVYHLGWGMLQSTPEFDWPLFDGRYFENGVEKRFQGHCTDLWFDQAMAWMKARKQQGEPFVCYLPTNAPHAPHVDEDADIAPYRGKGPAGFFGMIAHVDRRFGDLERFLLDEGLVQNTIVVFMTDNGGTSGVKTHNAGLRAGKTTYYDGGHRVPCWIRWPAGGLGQPRDIDVPTQNTDLLPTLCELAGLDPPTFQPADALYQGASLAGLLRGAEAALPDRKLVVQYGQIPRKDEACVIWNQWRLVNGKELYDVRADRAQTTDLAARHPDVVAELRAYHDRWWRGLEPLLDDFVPIHLGAPQQPVVELTSGDWEGIYADNSGYVRQAVGGPTGGHWNVLVEQPGTYRFTLRRWPEQVGKALGALYEPTPRSPPALANLQTRGFPAIAQAHLTIGGLTAMAAADPAATAATITADLPAGRSRLKAWFADARGEGQCGAFFVTVEKR
jgi:arylsulfatase A-like enzyme